MAQLSVTMTGDEAKLWASYQKIVREQVKLEDGLKKTAKESRKAAQESDRLARSAKRVYTETRTPMERHRDRLKQLVQMLGKNKISAETYGRAVKQSMSTSSRETSTSGTLRGSTRAVPVALYTASSVSKPSRRSTSCRDAESV